MSQKEVDALYKKRWLTYGEAAKLLGISRQATWEFTQKYKFKTFTINGKPHLKSEDIVDYAIKRRREISDKMNKVRLPSWI